MDLFAKAVKSGIAKGYAAGQQQLQQHLAKQRNSGGDDAGGYYGGQPNAPATASSYSAASEQQYYAAQASHAGPPPPLPPRQYYPPPQHATTTYEIPPPAQYTPVNYGTNTAASEPNYSYSSILPPPPPTYIPPTEQTPAPAPNFTTRDPALQYEGAYDYSDQFAPIPRRPFTPVERPVQRQPEYHNSAAAEVQFEPIPRRPFTPVERPPVRQEPDRTATDDQFAPIPRRPFTPVERPVVRQEAESSAADVQFMPIPRRPFTPIERPEVNAPIRDTPVVLQLEDLTLREAPAKAQTPEATRKRKPKKCVTLPPIEAEGPGKEVVRFCPEERRVDYPLYWYKLEGLPSSSICTRCHADYIKATALEKCFTKYLAEPETVSTCDFRYFRVQNILWADALKTGHVNKLVEFLSKRTQIQNCKGRNATTGPDGVKYFGMKDNDIPGFIACEACFEDRIVDTAFEPRFTPYEPVQGKNDRWICDVSILYVQKALAEMSQENDWSSFVAGASRRFKLATCEGKELARGDSGNWYTTREKMDNFQVCEACYMDRIELDSFSSEFEQMPGHVDFDQYIEFLRQRWTCSLPSGTLPMPFALDAAKNKDDFSIFQKAARAITQLVPCTQHGIIRGNWWSLIGGCDNFDICEACFEGIMKPNELDRFLEPKKRAPEDTVICDFCTAAPRFNEYLNKFAETLDRGIFSCYGDYVRTFAAVQACPRRDHLEKSKWWGYGEALFCENCYLVFVRHTSLSEHMPLQGEYDERAQICQIWSPRMRSMWRAVCDAGSPGSPESEAELLKFRAFGSKRLEVYLQTVPRIKFIRTMKDIKMMQAMNQGQLSLMYSGMNSMAVLSDTTDGYMHGNSSLGWYETENGATGAQMFNNMQSGMADAARTDEWMQIFQLELMWQEVE